MSTANTAKFPMSGYLYRGVYTSPDEYPEPFNRIVRTPSVASGCGYCLQTAHLESLSSRLKTGRPSELPGPGRTVTPHTSSPQGAGVISMLELSISSAHAVRSASDIEK